MNYYKIRQGFLFATFLIIFDSCTTTTKKNQDNKLASINDTIANPDPNMKSYTNTFYKFSFQLPKDFQAVFEENKKGGFNVQSKKDTFKLASYGFSPFAVEDIKTSTATLWKELTPAGTIVNKEGYVSLSGYKTYAITGMVNEKQMYTTVALCYDEKEKKDFLIFLTLPVKEGNLALSYKILKSIRRL